MTEPSLPPTPPPPPPGANPPGIAQTETAQTTQTTLKPAKRRMPAWMIALPLMALAGYGGFVLGNKGGSSTSSGAGTGGPGMSAGPGASGGTSGGSSSRSGRGASGSSTSPGQSGTGQGSAGQGSGPSSSGTASSRSAGSTQGGQTASGTGSRSATGSSRRSQTGSGAAGTAGANTNPNTNLGSGAVIAVTAAEVHAGTLTTDRTATGTVAASQTTTVNTRTSGTVSDVYGSVGQQVKAGQTIVRLTSNDLNASVQSAQNALASAQSQLTNQTATLNAAREQLQQNVDAARLSLQNAQNTLEAQQKLFAIGAVAKSAVDAQQVSVQQARSSLANAQNSLNQNTISRTTGLRDQQLAVDKARIALQQAQDSASNVSVVAPFDGQITSLPVTSGVYLNAGTAAFSLTSTVRNLTFNVPPAQATSLNVGRELKFKVGQTSYPIKVSGNPGAATSGVVPITARFIGEQWPEAGAVGAVSYTTAVGKGVLVPTTALQVDNDTTGVFVVTGGKATLKTVAVIGQTGDTAVVSGLADGAQVIATPPAGLLDGANVTTDSAAAKAGGMGGPGGPGGMP